MNRGGLFNNGSRKFAGLTFHEIHELKLYYINTFAKFYELLFKETIDINDNKLIWIALINIESELIEKLNTKLDSIGSRFRVKTLDNSLERQFIDFIKKDIDNMNICYVMDIAYKVFLIKGININDSDKIQIRKVGMEELEHCKKYLLNKIDVYSKLSFKDLQIEYEIDMIEVNEKINKVINEIIESKEISYTV